MGLTYQQAIAIGIGHLHPDADGRAILPADPPRERAFRERDKLLSADEPPPRPSRRTVDGLNKLERRFRDEILKPAYAGARIAEWWREPLKLRIAGRTFYTVDFVAVERPGDDGSPPRIVMLELKGFLRDDASVKIKVAAGMYPVFRWLLVIRPAKAWEVREVTGSGIGRNPVRIPWINGDGR